MSERFADKAWLFICEEETRIDIYKVLNVLRRYNYNEVCLNVLSDQILK